MYRRQELEFLKRELADTDSETTIDGGGESGERVLATILPTHDEHASEGHFYVEPLLDGSWKVHGRPYPPVPIVVSESVSLTALSALAVETLLEARQEYRFVQHGVDERPLPPPSVRRKVKSDLAEELVAKVVGGEIAGTGNHGFDVLGPDERRIQVKCSKRNKRNGLISTLAFKSEAAWAGHDELIYIEFDEHNYPVAAWSIPSDALREFLSKGTGINNEKKNHQLEGLLKQSGADITSAVRNVFHQEYLDVS